MNHNGDRELGRRQIRAAVAAGADAVKLQSFRADELATASAPSAEYQSRAGAASQHEMLRALELSADDLAALLDEGRRSGVVAFATPFDPASVKQLASLGVEWMKVPSGELTNHELVRAVGATGLPTFLSTGMATLEEIRAAVAAFREAGTAAELVVMHCVSSYPAPLEQMNLRAIPALRDALGVPVGLSDHTTGRDAAVAAVALGACAVEKHFTVDRRLPGPDHAMSMEPEDFGELVRAIRALDAGGLGSGEKVPVPAELPIREVARRSIVAARALAAGTRLARADLAVKRPAGGLAPAALPRVIGRTLRRAVEADERIEESDLR